MFTDDEDDDIGPVILLPLFLGPFIAILVTVGIVGGIVLSAGDDEEVAAPAVTTTTEAPTPTTAAPAPILPDVRAALDGNGFNGVGAAMSGGTVAVLTGVVASQEDKDAAEATARAVDRVTDVDNQLTIEAPKKAARLRAAATDDSIVLTGAVPDTATKDAIREAAEARYGAANVTDELTIDDGTTMEGSSMILAGELATEGDVSDTFDAFAPLAGDGVEIDNRLTVAAGPTLAASLNELFQLQPIEFDVNSATIRASSVPTLDQAVQILTDQPEGNLEIGGHTDSDGSDESNLALSQARADSVRQYLTDNGVDAARLTTNGYGEANPVDDNATPEGKQNNRRIEFTEL